MDPLAFWTTNPRIHLAPGESQGVTRKVVLIIDVCVHIHTHTYAYYPIPRHTLNIH